MKRKCRWGILGAASIARKNWQAVRDAGNAELVAVASRDMRRARKFVRECQAAAAHPVLPSAMGSYEALLARSDIDAVYLPLPTALRKEWVLKAAAAGKHVLAEKPAGGSADDVKEMLDACEKHGVQFMDGVMFMHGRRLQRLRRVVDQEIGQVRHIATQFSFLGGPEFLRSDIRTQGRLEPLGCLGDLGWYCLRFTLWAMGEKAPLSVIGRMHSEVGQGGGVPPVPTEFSGILSFAEGVSASFHCSFTAANAQWARVSGSEGLLDVSDFVLPFSGRQTRYGLTRSEFVVKGCRFDMKERHRVKMLREPANNAPGSQEANMFQAFSKRVLSGECDPAWPQSTLLTQRVLDACWHSARQGSRVISL